MTIPPTATKNHRDTMLRIMLYKLSAYSVYIVPSSVLALMATGKTTGLVIESGHGCTYAVPIYETSIVKTAVRKIDFAGNDVTEHMMTFISNKLPRKSRHYLIRSTSAEIKEKHGFVTLEFEKELPHVSPIVLPDMKIERERTEGPETLFNPAKMKEDHLSIQQIAYDAIMNCDEEMRKDLCDNIVLCGGNTMFPGFVERFQKELRKLVPMSLNIKVHAPPDRANLAWIGGSILGRSRVFERMWITKQEYSEIGTKIADWKWF
jgi:actin